MAIQQINLGNIVNDGLGDDLRTAFEKVNANFGFVDEQIEIVLNQGAENVGAGVPIYKGKEDNVLQFKTLVAGQHIAFDELTDTVTVRSTSPTPFTRIDTNLGVINSSDFQEITIQGGNDINVTATGQVITIDATSDAVVAISAYDFGPMVGSDNSLQFCLAAANIDFGIMTILGRASLDLGNI